MGRSLILVMMFAVLARSASEMTSRPRSPSSGRTQQRGWFEKYQVIPDYKDPLVGKRVVITGTRYNTGETLTGIVLRAEDPRPGRDSFFTVRIPSEILVGGELRRGQVRSIHIRNLRRSRKRETDQERIDRLTLKYNV